MSLLRVVREVVHRRAMLTAGLGAAIGIDLAIFWQLRRIFVTPLGDGEQTLMTAAGSAVLLALALAGLGAAIGWSLVQLRHNPARRARDAALHLERLVPASRNLLFTAWETETQGPPTPRAIGVEAPGTAHTSPGVTAHTIMHRRAAALASSLDVSSLLPWTSVRKALLASVLLWALTLLVTSMYPAGAATRAARNVVARATGAMTIDRVDVQITPPAYSAIPSSHLRNPARIEGLEGSQLTFTVAASGGTLVISTDSGDVLLPPPTRGDYQWRMRLRHDGFVAFALRRSTDSTGTEALDARARDSEPRLIPIVMQRDASPRVRITKPGRDLFVDSARRVLEVRIEASDDIALHALSLHYTTVAGAGERFTFQEGQTPLRTVKTSREAWHADATLPLDSLLREPGDLVVYRAQAADGRPGVPPVESDAFIVERTATGGIAAAGFALDPDEDRYAVSQQMVILKTERLIAAQSTLTGEALAEQARQIAFEQRRVRAEFVFMTGGEFEQEVVADEEGMADLDESHEAENEADLAAGRMVNRGRTALLTAIRAMSRAALALGESNLSVALQQERVALDRLQEAFARQRFLMRALSQREQLDLTRRLTGTLDSIAHGAHAAPTAEPQTQRLELRQVLDALLLANRDAAPALETSPAPAPASGSRAAARAAAGAAAGAAPNPVASYPILAVRILQLEPGSRRAQQIAQWLQIASRNRAARDSATFALSAWLTSITRIDATPPRIPQP